MNISSTEKEGHILLQIDGRVDTNTSTALLNEILEAFDKKRKLVLDFEKVSYISSAGLRSLLIGQKTAAGKKAEMELINVSGTVRTVLDSVGFSKILTIK